MTTTKYAQWANPKAYENPGFESSEYGPGDHIEACRWSIYENVTWSRQQHCVGPEAPLQATIAATRISRISRISVPLSPPRETVMLRFAWEPIHA